MRLVLCTPSRGQFSTGYRNLFKDVALMCAEREVEFDVFDDFTDGEKHQARNLLLFRIAEELEDEDFAYWLDSDVSHHPQLIFELLSREEEIIARNYKIRPYEDNEPNWCGSVVMRGNRVLYSDDAKLVEAISFGFGAVLMRATAAKKLREHCGVVGRGGRGKRSIPAFDLRVDGWNTLCGEDVSFCGRWREELGGKLWIAPNGYVRNGAHGGQFSDELKGFAATKS